MLESFENFEVNQDAFAEGLGGLQSMQAALQVMCAEDAEKRESDEKRRSLKKEEDANRAPFDPSVRVDPATFFFGEKREFSGSEQKTPEEIVEAQEGTV